MPEAVAKHILWITSHSPHSACLTKRRYAQTASERLKYWPKVTHCLTQMGLASKPMLLKHWSSPTASVAHNLAQVHKVDLSTETED